MEEKKLLTENELDANGGTVPMIGFLGIVIANGYAFPVASADSAQDIGTMTDVGPLSGSAQTPCFKEGSPISGSFAPDVFER